MLQLQWWVSLLQNGRSTGRGDCHRYPPRTVCELTSERDEYDGKMICIKSEMDDYWPTTDSDDFCGEFKLKIHERTHNDEEKEKPDA